MKAVLLSVRPTWCELIAQGKKTLEIRKSAPKMDEPFKCYIYCTNGRPWLVWGDRLEADRNWHTRFTRTWGYSREDAEKIWDVFNGRIMGEFVCDYIKPILPNSFIVAEDAIKEIEGSALTVSEVKQYGGWLPETPLCDCKDLYGWHISKLDVYDTPRPISDFGLTRPPQSWRYLGEEEETDGGTQD